jgi:ferredoxin
MLIDCDTCTVRGQACGECVVNLLFGEAPMPSGAGADAGVDMAHGDDAERRALQVLADAGFEVTVLSREDSRPRLRLLPGRRRGHHAA